MKTTGIIKQDILNAIEHHQLLVGGYPSIDDITDILDKSHHTIRKCMNQLKAEGFLVRRISQWRRDGYEVTSFEYTGVRK